MGNRRGGTCWVGKALTFHGFENRRVARHNRHPAVASHLDLHPVRMFQIPNRLPAFPDNAALVSPNVQLETRFFFALVFTVRLCSVFLGLLGVLFRLVSASRVYHAPTVSARASSQHHQQPSSSHHRHLRSRRLHHSPHPGRPLFPPQVLGVHRKSLRLRNGNDKVSVV
jgi:hypothetical protein